MTSKYDLYYEIDEFGTGYYIYDRNERFGPLYQPEKYVLYKRDTIEESAQAHIDRILRDEAEAEKERISIEDLQKQIDNLKTENEELKKINAEQDTMLAELAML